MDGIFNVNKPIGITSTEVVRKFKRLTGVKRVGHAGTLDPLASGVLPICVGKATRVIEYLIDQHRSYRGLIHLGIQTDTFDKEGRIIGENTAYKNPTEREILKGLSLFIGDIKQIPPMYSAIKINGDRLYDLARKGITLDLQSRPVQVFDISLMNWNPPVVDLKVNCGKGFYMRSLANDLGRELGMGAYLEELTRLKHGPFDIEKSVDFGSVENIFNEGSWSDIIQDVDSAIRHIPKILADPQFEEHILNGRPVPVYSEVPLGQPKEIRRLYSRDNRFIGIIEFNDVIGAWCPKKVININVDRKLHAK